MEAIMRLPKPITGLKTNLKSCIALMVMCASVCVMTGCSVESEKQAAQDIANAIPQALPYIATAQAIVDSLDPMAAPLVDAGVAAVNVGLGLIQTALTNYAASPSATTWGSIVDAVNQTLNTNANTILNLAHVTNSDSRTRALIVMGAIQTALLLLISIVQRVHDAITQSKVNAAAKSMPVKVSFYKDYLDRNQIEQATGYTFNQAVAYETSQGF